MNIEEMSLEELLKKIYDHCDAQGTAEAEILRRFAELENLYKHTHKVEYVAGITRPYEQKIAELEAQVAELKDFAIWMTGCGYDFCQHEYFIKQRDVLLKV